MHTKIALTFCGVFLLVMATMARAQDPTQVMGLDPPGDHGCIAWTLVLEKGQALAGVQWFNNDQQAPFEKILLMEGTEGVAPDLSETALILQEIPAASLAWDHVDLDFPVVSTTGVIQVVFVFPAGLETTALGAGGGPGLGVKEAAAAPDFYLSPDGLQWARYIDGYTLAVQPVLLPLGSGKRAAVVLGSLKGDVDDLGAGKSAEIPIEATRLYAAVPNPFNPRTMIQYDLAASSKVALKVYNVRGRLVKTLTQGMQPRGRYRVVWLGDDDRGVSVASGVYFVRLEAGGQQMRQKVTLVR